MTQGMLLDAARWVLFQGTFYSDLSCAFHFSLFYKQMSHKESQ